jgi:hypothetical protein
MKKSILYILMAGLLTLVMAEACKHDPVEPITQPTTTSGTTTGNPIPSDSVCFNTQILPFFISTCGSSGCHSATNPQKGFNLTTYTGIMQGIVPNKPAEGKIMKEIIDGEMPPAGPLTATQKALLEKWISEGATQRNCINTCDTNNVTYTNQVASVIQTYCVGCHNGSSGSGGVNLNSYTAVKNETLNGKLICTILQTGGCSPMPKSGPKLSLCDIRKFELWRTANCPQ